MANHPLDAPLLNSGDENPSFSTCAFLGLGAFAATALMDDGHQAVAHASQLGVAVVGTWLAPKLLSFFQVRRRRAQLSGLAGTKKTLVAERNAAIVAALGFDRALTKAEKVRLCVWRAWGGSTTLAPRRGVPMDACGTRAGGR